MVGIIGAVGRQSSERLVAIEKACCDPNVVAVVGSQDEDARPALGIGEAVELAGAAAARLDERVLEGPLFARRPSNAP